MEHAVHRCHHHRVDQAADELLCFATPALRLKGVEQALDLAAVNLRQTRVQQGGGHCVGAGCQLGLEISLAPTHAIEFVRNERGVDAFEDGRLQSVDARGHVAKLGLPFIARRIPLLRQPITLDDVFGDERLDDVRLHHVVAQRRQHLLLKFVDAHRQPVRAGRRSLLGRGMASGPVFPVL
nr:hypothetical protein [Sphingomonas oligophenolica]